MIKENDLSLKGTVDSDDKVRIVTKNGLSQSIEVDKLKSSFIDELSDRVDTLEDNDTANNTAHSTMNSRLKSLESAVGDEGKGEIPASGLVKKVSDIESNLAKIDPGEINRLGVAIDGADGVDGIHKRLTAIDGTNGRLDRIDGENSRLDKIDGRLDKIDGEDGQLNKIDGRLDVLEDRVENLDNTKLDQLAFQNAVAAGFKIINKTPASASATGQPGEVCWDTKYFYVCVASNTWKRTPLESW